MVSWRSPSRPSRRAGSKTSSMYFVYILKDRKNKLYFGYSNNLERRLSEHKNKKVYTTKRMSEPELIYYEAYNNEEAAIIRERKLKQFGSAYVGLLKRLQLK